ncbi:disulfide bond formation protein DsbD [Vibrio cholerae]|nr:disulfide bond formation protein DsbD [Vibrio cholerae]
MLDFHLVVTRCQPLKRALCLIHKTQQVVIVNSFGISFRFCRQFNIVFRCLMKRQCAWRCKF